MKNITILLCFISSLYSLAQDVELDLFASGFNRPVSIKHAGDNRLFIAEQDGIIKILNANGTIETTNFLDIDAQVRSTGNEQGLLGLAFHPNYATNGYFFVNYINNSGNTVVSRFSRNATNPSLANPNSELIILSYNQPFSNHNGGDMAFGADGYLYISSGDGGSGGDPQNNSQNLGNLLGKIIRIDVNNATVANPYIIPTDNPFIGNSSALDEIWAYGLRNPWRFSFDSLTNAIWIADVGQNEYEEINTAPATSAGLNYGWRCYEGNTTFNNTGCPSSNTLTFPVAEYSHSSSGEFKCSITGGYSYRGNTYPNFVGLYFFADYCSGEIGYLKFENNNWTMTLKDFPGNWVTFGKAVDGELLVADISGNIYKLRDTLLSVEDNKLSAVTIFPNPAKTVLSLKFSVINSQTEISILDIQGKTVKTFKSTNTLTQEINISALKSGFYFLKVRSKDAKEIIKTFVIN